MKFREEFNVEKIAKMMVEAGVARDANLDEIIAGGFAGYDITVSVGADPVEVINWFDDDAIIDRYSEIKGSANDRAIEDGIRYVREGELELARAMFACVFEGSDFDAADRALS